MRSARVALALDALMLLLLWIAIGRTRWDYFWVAMAVFVAMIVYVRGRRLVDVLPPRPVWMATLVVIGLILLSLASTVLHLGLPGRGRGLSIPGEGVATLFVAAAVLGTVGVVWAVLWKSLPRERPPWKARAYGACLLLFAGAPAALFLLDRFGALEDHLKLARQMTALMLFVMAVAFAIASALPHLDQRVLGSAGGKPAAAPVGASTRGARTGRPR